MKSLKLRLLLALVTVLLITIVPTAETKAQWSTRGPYGGPVSAFTLIDSAIYLGSPTGGVYRSIDSRFTTWVYRNYNGLGSGKVTALSSVGRVVVAATVDSGIYISANLGTGWVKKNFGLTNLSILSLAADGGRLYAGTAGGGVFVSSDTGNTWTAQNTGLGGLTINALRAKGDTLLAGTAVNGVYASINGGAAWLAFNTGLADQHITSLAYVGTAIFAATPSGVFSGSLTTFAWSFSSAGLGNTEINDLLIKADTVYAATNAGIYYSPVSSVSWSAAGLLTDTVNALIAYNATILAGTKNNGAYKSTIGSLAWSAVNAGFNNRQSYASAAKDSLVVVANELGVFVCKNFVQSVVYVQSNNGLSDSLQVQALQIGAGKLFAGTANGIYVSTDTGASWTAANTGLTSLHVTRLLATDSKLYAVTSDGKVFSSPLSSVSWTIRVDDLPLGFNITSIVNIGDTIAIGCEIGVYVSIGGAFWAALYPFHHSVTALAVRDRALYIGTDTAGVFKTTFGSGVFTPVNTGLPDLNIQALATVGQYIVVGYKGGAKASCNGAKTWHEFATLEYIPNYSGILGFVHTTRHIFALTPQHGLLGNSKAELPDVKPDTLGFLPGGSYCKEPTFKLSVPTDIEASSYQWRLPDGWTGSSTANTIVAVPVPGFDTVYVAAINGCGSSPEAWFIIETVICAGINDVESSLYAVFPNPFNQGLVVKSEVMDKDVVAYIHDVTGKTVTSSPLTGQSTAINTASLAKGIYFLSIVQDGRLVSTSKVVKPE